jgi:molecular chaperone HtpG
MNNEINSTPNEFEFKAEMKQLLHIIVHSLYTNKDIFIRELVSNSSDALNKLRFRRLTDSNIIEPEKELKINITLDKDNKIFTIEDTGIGMTKDELIGKIGTVASSGTLEFLKLVKETDKPLDAQLIGQFGVGFYSVFMVTDEITIETRHADLNSKSFRWKSKGEDKFTIEEIDRPERGTKIYFKLNEEAATYIEDWNVKNILQKYSNFVNFPIYVNNEEVNKVTALWHKKKEDIKNEELNEFYKFISNDFQPPLGHLLLSIEGGVNFKALVFIPETAPPMLFRDAFEKSLQLYSKRVFIQDECKELLPDYLRFIRGVVDTEDLPLNVSREVTQSSPVMTKIKNVLTSKVLSLLEEWADKDKGKYEKFYNNFGSLFKTGINSDFTNKNKIVELLRFETSNQPKGELTSFNGYVSRMKPDQKNIYFISGDHRDIIERNPNLEYFRKKEIEVIFLTDPVDIFTIPYLNEYDGKPLQSIEKQEIGITKDEVSKGESIGEDVKKSIISLFKDTLKDKVEDVIESMRLVESAATLVVGKQGFDPQMEKMMQMMDKQYSASKRILEINTSHPLIKNLAKLYIADSNNPILLNCINQLFEGALLIEGQLKSPNDFVRRMTQIMEEATKN